MTAAQITQHSEASKIAQFMGLRNWQRVNELALVEKVESGLPVTAADTIIRRIDPKGIHLDVYDIIPKATYYRRKEQGKRLTRDQSEKVLALSKVFAEIMRQYSGDSDAAVMFITKPHPLLGGRTPLDVANGSTTGADLVLDLLARAEAGVAV